MVDKFMEKTRLDFLFIARFAGCRLGAKVLVSNGGIMEEE